MSITFVIIIRLPLVYDVPYGNYILYLPLFSVKIAQGALVCDECELVGDITIGELIRG